LLDSQDGIFAQNDNLNSKETMKIKLIFPKKPGDPGAMGVTVPYVLPHLAALTPPGHDVSLVNLFKEKLDLSDRPDLVGISVMTPMADEAYAIADSCRAMGIKVVLGGHHVSALPHEAKRHADAVVVGEAEDTWPALVGDMEAGRPREFYVAGPLYDGGEFSAGNTFHVQGRPALDKLPLPKRGLLKGRYFFDSIVTTRGCPYQCRFCGTSRFYGGTVRHRPVEDVVAEVKRMGRFWLMADDDIFGDPGYRLELYERLDGLKRFMRWHGAGSLAVAFDRSGDEMLRLAARSGLDAVFVGLESAEADTLQGERITAKLRQGDAIDFKKTAGGIRRIKGHGIMALGFFVLGFDTDSRETFDKTLRLCDETGVVPIPFLLMPLPGTPLWDDYEPRLFSGLGWGMWDAVHAIYSHPALSARDREEMLYRLRRSSYTFGRVVRRLKGLGAGTAFYSLMMQFGLKRSFEADWKRVNKHRDTEAQRKQTVTFWKR
jgi:radical SAM superfamily enzyme YgiQ (UPF0313 family)